MLDLLGSHGGSSDDALAHEIDCEDGFIHIPKIPFVARTKKNSMLYMSFIENLCLCANSWVEKGCETQKTR